VQHKQKAVQHTK